jgi:hypothetical protein
MPWINRVIALTLIALAVPLWRMAGDFPGSAAAFPRAVLAALASLAAVMLARSFIPAYARRAEGAGFRGAAALPRPLAAFAAASAAVLLMPAIGFFPAALALAAAFYLLLGVRSLRTYAATVAVLLAFVYVVFVLLLGVPLGVGQMAAG